MKKLLKFKDFLGTAFLYNVKKCIKNGLIITTTITLLLIVSILPNILTCNVYRCFNYLPTNVAYVKNSPLVEEVLAKDPDLVRVYHAKCLTTFNTLAYSFSQKEDICTFTRTVFLNDDFNGIVVSVKKKSDINELLIGSEVRIPYKSTNNFNDIKYIKGKIVNFCYTDDQKEILPMYMHSFTEALFINENFVDLSNINFNEEGNSYYTLTYNKDIDKKIDKKLYELLVDTNDYATTPLSYTSHYTLVSRNLHALRTIITFLQTFTYIFLTFALIVLIFMVNVEFDDKKYEIKIRKRLGIDEHKLNIQLILGSLLKIIIYFLISFAIFSIFIYILNIDYTNLNIFSLNYSYYFILIILLLVITIINSSYSTYKNK